MNEYQKAMKLLRDRPPREKRLIDKWGDPGIWSYDLVGWITPEGSFSPADLGKARKLRSAGKIKTIIMAREDFQNNFPKFSDCGKRVL